MSLVSKWLAEGIEDDDIKTELALTKAFQEVCEAIMDLLAMILKDSSVPPTDNYSNIEKALNIGVINVDQSMALREANGLRNRLIHMYNGIDMATLVESATKLLPRLEESLEMITGWLQARSMK
ncbi:MAG: DUF86 domain-containing protein [Candidatus Thorarchaeota archaeon]